MHPEDHQVEGGEAMSDPIRLPNDETAKTGFWATVHDAVLDGWGATIRLCVVLIMLTAAASHVTDPIARALGF
jgi:hypothetical protein